MSELQEKTGKRIRRHILVAADALTRAADGTFCPEGTLAEDCYVEAQLEIAKEAIEMGLASMKDYKNWCSGREPLHVLEE